MTLEEQKQKARELLSETPFFPPLDKGEIEYLISIFLNGSSEDFRGSTFQQRENCARAIQKGTAKVVYVPGPDYPKGWPTGRRFLNSTGTIEEPRALLDESNGRARAVPNPAWKHAPYREVVVPV